jgi:hypothetical protein
VTSSVYWLWLISPWVSPYSAAIERHEADGEAGFPVAAQRHRVDLGAGQEREDQRPHAGQERDEVGGRDVLADAGDVAGQGPDHDLDQGRGDGDADADHRGEQGHAEPDRRYVVDVHLLLLPGPSRQQAAKRLTAAGKRNFP